MTAGICARCGAKDSMFWYPYAFGVAPIPSVTDSRIDRSQYFMLCDDCQVRFVDFMKMKIEIKMNPYYDVNNLKKRVDETEPVIVPEVKE